MQQAPIQSVIIKLIFNKNTENITVARGSTVEITRPLAPPFFLFQPGIRQNRPSPKVPINIQQ